MRGVMSSSLLGSILENPFPDWVFDFLSCLDRGSKSNFGVIFGVIFRSHAGSPPVCGVVTPLAAANVVCTILSTGGTGSTDRAARA